MVPAIQFKDFIFHTNLWYTAIIEKETIGVLSNIHRMGWSSKTTVHDRSIVGAVKKIPKVSDITYRDEPQMFSNSVLWASETKMYL